MTDLSRVLLALALAAYSSVAVAADCNRNGVDDTEDIFAGTSDDCDANQVPDECDLARLRFGFRYEGRQLPPSPEGVVAADLNGDGRVDFATGSQDDQRASVISVMLVGADGSLAEPVSYPSAERLSGLTAADIDADGDVDLVTANSRSVEWQKNAGDGTFTPGTSTPVPDGTRRIAPGEFTGDGLPDLVVANTRSGDVTVLSNLGGGMLQEGRGVPVESRPASLVAVDLDGDGQSDVAVAGDSSDDLVVLRGTGDGRLTFSRRREFTTNVSRVHVEDFDGDGALDLAVGLRDSLVFLHSPGILLEPLDETTLAVPSAVLIGGDWDGDGDTDLVTGAPGNSRVVTTLVNTNGLFGAQETVTVEFLLAASGDVDQDGDDDIALVSVEPDRIALLFSNEDATFTLPLESSVLVAREPRKPHSIVAADLDGDGRPEVATSDGHDRTVSLFRNANGALEHAGEVPFRDQDTGHLNSIAHADLDADGDVDFLIADREAHRVGVLLNRGDGTYPGPVQYPAGGEPFMVAAGDLDADGAIDFVTANKTANTVTVYRNRGDATFANREDLAVGVQPFAAALGDLDGDGRLDLVTANATSVSLSVLRGAGGGQFEAASEVPVFSAPRYVTAADLDGDGDLDLATADDEVSVLLNRGDGTYQPLEIVPVGGGCPYSVLATDVNADGRRDLAVVSEENSTVVVLIGRGNGTFPLQFRFWLNDAPRFVAAADFNDDGLVDLVGTNRRSRNLTVFMSRPPEEFLPVDPEQLCGSAPPRFVRGDSNADGRRNLVDAVASLEFLFRDGFASSCAKAMDTNDDGRVNLLDPLTLLDFLLREGPPPPAPSAACGQDPTPDGISCDAFAGCG